MTHLFFAAFLLFSTALVATPAENKAEAPLPVPVIINKHYLNYAKMEHFSAIQVSIKAAGQMNTFVKGNKALTPGSAEITKDDLFEIGSISKSFTAALAVMADSADKIKLDQVLGEYLKVYPHWGSIRLTQLLDMSSGLPNYSDSPKLNYSWSKNLKQFWNPVELVDLVYPKQFNPPRKSGYFYSNTGYVLMDMILSMKYKETFRRQLEKKIISFLGLKNTYYPVPNFSTDVLAKMVHGYSFNIYSNPELLGQDITENNLSWGGAAGALVSNSEDVIRWVENLFIGDLLLNTAQKMRMQTLVSVKTGKPLEQTNADEPRGFGLGIIQAFDPEIGRYWFYEGETLGYRALYLYVPCNEVIISALFNSATNSENDHAGELIKTLYANLLKQNTQLVCQNDEALEIKKSLIKPL